MPSGTKHDNALLNQGISRGVRRILFSGAVGLATFALRHIRFRLLVPLASLLCRSIVSGCEGLKLRIQFVDALCSAVVFSAFRFGKAPIHLVLSSLSLSLAEPRQLGLWTFCHCEHLQRTWAPHTFRTLTQVVHRFR